MPLPYPTIISDFRPDPDPFTPSEAPPSPSGIVAKELMEGSQIPKSRAKYYNFNTQEVSGLDITFHGHHEEQGWIRVGVCATYTDGDKLHPIYLARQARLVECRKDFEALQEEYRKGKEAQEVKSARDRLTQARVKEAAALVQQAKAQNALNRAVREEDLPPEPLEEALEQAHKAHRRARDRREYLEKALQEAEAVYQENWKQVRSLWLQDKNQASLEKEAMIEEEMIAQLAQMAAQLEGQQALTRELYSSFYSSLPAPELEAPAPIPEPITPQPISSQVKHDTPLQVSVP